MGKRGHVKLKKLNINMDEIAGQIWMLNHNAAVAYTLMFLAKSDDFSITLNDEIKGIIEHNFSEATDHMGYLKDYECYLEDQHSHLYKMVDINLKRLKDVADFLSSCDCDEDNDSN